MTRRWSVGVRPRSTLFFILPAFAVYTLLIVYPMIDSLIVSLLQWDGVSSNRTFVGLKNYVDFFTDPHSIEVLLRTLLWAAGTVIVPSLLGLCFAIALDRRLPCKVVFRSIFYLSYIMPLVAVGIIWSWIYNPDFGALNAFFHAVGLKGLAIGWLSNPRYALWSVMGTSIWSATGFPMVLFLAGLQTIPGELYEAAHMDGARAHQRFWNITIPMLRETFVVVIALLIINSLKAFDLIYVMTWGGPGRNTQVLGVWMYFNTFLFDKAGFGSAVAWVMTVVSLAIAVPYIQVLTRDHLGDT